jgi:hypothetical protein
MMVEAAAITVVVSTLSENSLKHCNQVFKNQNLVSK